MGIKDGISPAPAQVIEGEVVDASSQEVINDMNTVADVEKKAAKESEINVAAADQDDEEDLKDDSSENVIIITGADAAAHLLPLRDDREPALTFRSLVMATILSGFQAVLNQIYSVG